LSFFKQNHLTFDIMELALGVLAVPSVKSANRAMTVYAPTLFRLYIYTIRHGRKKLTNLLFIHIIRQFKTVKLNLQQQTEGHENSQQTSITISEKLRSYWICGRRYLATTKNHHRLLINSGSKFRLPEMVKTGSNDF